MLKLLISMDSRWHCITWVSDQCWLLWMQSGCRAGCLGSVSHPCSGETFFSVVPSPKPNSQASVRAPQQSLSLPGSHWTLKKWSDTNTSTGQAHSNHTVYANKQFAIIMYWGADAYFRTDLVHNMTKLMKVCLHFMVLQERRPSFPGFGEVGHHCCHRELAFPIRFPAAGL